MHAWRIWISNQWQSLRAGQKLCVSQERLPHPQDLQPHFRSVSGWPKGQACDWALPMADESRVHVQCYQGRDGTLMFCIHRDQWDPDRSFGLFLKHMLFETPMGPALGIGALAALVVNVGK